MFTIDGAAEPRENTVAMAAHLVDQLQDVAGSGLRTGKVSAPATSAIGGISFRCSQDHPRRPLELVGADALLQAQPVEAGDHLGDAGEGDGVAAPDRPRSSARTRG